MHFLLAINSDISVLIVCNKTGGTVKGDILKKKLVKGRADSGTAKLQAASNKQVNNLLTRQTNGAINIQKYFVKIIDRFTNCITRKSIFREKKIRRTTGKTRNTEKMLIFFRRNITADYFKT